MMILLKGGEIHSPKPLGKKDILLAGGKIVAIADNITEPKGIDVEVINIEGLKVFPGLIDGHIHFAGAGGESGPATRTPAVQLSQIIDGGITTVIGSLGTDGITRSVKSVLMKAKSLNEEGITAYILTGSYQIPVYTITGSPERDICMIDECIGVGEIAISDHRSSQPTVDELVRLAEHTRVAGMLSGKAGMVLIHLGDDKNALQPMYDAIERVPALKNHFFPTHCTRNDYLFEDCKEWGKKGFNIDMTASSYPYFPQYEIKPSKAVKILLEAGVPLAKLHISSDAGGSLPDFDKDGNLISLHVGLTNSITKEMVDMIREEKLPIETALSVVSTNIAKTFKLEGKGLLEAGMDADILLMDKDYNVYSVLAKGEWMIKEMKMLRKGTFE